ncbi:gamma carbonic anhydrase family protein [Pelagicoccus sp. SDUM812003]|uniref:gamma carbonic anhydrase family protein n=1 Tax=Pelagicoccus sp. SDUM812003 TaxID=3041267 RepID=UPI00280D8C0E|nr:gamma carbonic anhydrase family protein [Pelagicoccus sp. SDUM812003]MDQ8205701.1 gamma carbonic anhydrase family protein [Pelagicoccus sp. SDUM812003]
MTTEERLETFLSKDPKVPESAYVAPQATLLGDVRLGEQASVWPGCVLRGDINYIEVGDRSNVQDGTIVHLADNYPVIIGKDVTIGHAAIVHACTIEDECLIGMGSTVMDGAVIGHNSIVGAGALVTPGTKIPPGSLVVGSPAKVKRSLSEEEQAKLASWALKYTKVAAAHKAKLS